MLIFRDLVPEWFLRGFVMDLVHLLETIWALFQFFCGLVFSVFLEPLPDSTGAGNVAEKPPKRCAFYTPGRPFCGIHDFMKIVTTLV